MGKRTYNLDLVFSNLLFGANFSFYVSLMHDALNYRQMFILQVLVAALTFIPFVLFSRHARMGWRDAGNILSIALLVVYGWLYMLVRGASYTSPIDASTIATLGPVFTLVAARVMNHSRIKFTWAHAAGVVLAFAGAAILLFRRGSVLVMGSEGFGNALVLVAVVAIALNTVIIKPSLVRLGTLTVMGWYYLIGLVVTLPFFWQDLLRIDFSALSAQGQAELLYILILGTVLPMYLLYRGTEKLTSVHTALYRYIQPVAATVLALARHQERIYPANAIAGVLIFGGVVLVAVDFRRRSSSRAT